MFCQELQQTTMIPYNYGKDCWNCRNCRKRAYFNYNQENYPKYCGVHKLDGMINIVYEKTDIDSRCLFYGCTTRPSYNFINSRKGVYCIHHKLDGMINVHRKFCAYKGCNKAPSFNFAGYKKRLYCSRHKLDGMVSTNIYKMLVNGIKFEGCDNYDMKTFTRKTCEFTGCDTVPTFNFYGINRPRFCKMHRLNGMINVILYKNRVSNQKHKKIQKDDSDDDEIYNLRHRINNNEICNLVCNETLENNINSEKFDFEITGESYYDSNIQDNNINGYPYSS